MSIKLGLALPQSRSYDISRDVASVAKAAEASGYESLWAFERVLFPTPATQGLYGIPGLDWPESYRGVGDPLITLTLAGAVTERARLGTSVLVAPLHVPFQLARSLATLDAATGGRVVAGLGTGWSLDEYAAASVAPFEKRGAVLDEVLDVFAAVWGADPVSYEGTLTHIAPAEVGPKPAGHLPVFLAASNGRAFRRLVDKADGWMPVAGGAAALSEGWQKLQEVAAERGRERPIDVIARANAYYSAKPFEGENRMPFQGSVEQLVEDLAAHAAVDGVSEILIDLQSTVTDAQEMSDVAAEIITAVHAAGI